MNPVERRATAVRRITAERAVLSYFRLVADDGSWNHPTDRTLRCERVADTFSVPERLFPMFSWPPDISGVLIAFQYYERKFGILVTHVRDEIKAVIADDEVVAALNLKPPAAVLLVDRVVFGMGGQAVEWRRSF